MAESLFLSDGVSPYIATTTPPIDGEIAQWSDSLNAWTNSTAPAGTGDVTASGTLTNNVVIVGGGTTVVKATTSPALGTPSATTLGVHVTTPEQGSILQVKYTTALAATSGDPVPLLITVPDESTYHFGILNTSFSQSTDDGFLVYQADDGTCSAGTGDSSLVFDPSGEIYTGGAFGARINPSDLGATAFASNRLVNNGTSGGGESANVFNLSVTQTDLTHSDGVNNVAIVTDYGQGGVASKGAAIGLSNIYQLNGCGDATDEPAGELSQFSVNIGSGFTQSAGPTPRVWFRDWSVYGPIAVQPSALSGITMLLQNNYNGSPSDGPSYGMSIVSLGGHGDATHGAATSYAFDVGLGITGFNSAGAAAFTTAIQIGGALSQWEEASSVIGTGIHIRDYTTRGIKIDNPSGSPTASIEADGIIKGATFLPTTGYKSVDGSTGATGTATAANTLGIKNGLVVSIT